MTEEILSSSVYLLLKEQWAKTGLMIRESMAVGSRFFGVFINARMGVTAEYRSTTSGWHATSPMTNATQFSIWFKVTKRMNVYTAFRSFDGDSWTLVGTPQTIAMDPSNLKVGIALTSSSAFRISEATYEQFENTNYFYPSAAPSQSMAPSHLIPSLDIGAHNVNYKSEVDLQGTKYIVNASGAGIWGSQDEFTFINFEVQGDFDMTTRVFSTNITTSWTKAGLMARDSVDRKSKMIFSLYAPLQGTMAHLRSQYGGSTLNFQPFWERTTWAWLRLKREGTTISAFRSITGNTLQECNWQLLRQFTSTDVSLGSTLQIGMAVTSSDTRKFGVVKFEKFEIQRPTSAPARALRGSI
jgi:hypothetical protein